MRWIIDNYMNVIIVLLLSIPLIFNKKVRVISIFKKQLYVFRDARTDAISIWDIICFLICPFILAILIVEQKGFVFSDTLKQILSQTYASIFAILTGFMTVIAGKKHVENNDIEKKVVNETGVAIGTAAIMAGICTIISLIMIAVNLKMLLDIFTIALLYFSFVLVMLMLMIIKRVFILYY